MTINKIRTALYVFAKILGDIQACSKAGRSKSMKPIGKRVARRIAGRQTGKLLGDLFR